MIASNVLRLSAFEYRSPRCIGAPLWDNFMGNLVVRDKALAASVQSSEKALNVNRLKWLGHILHISAKRLPRGAL